MDDDAKVGEEAVAEEAVSQKATPVGDAPPPREHCTVCQEAIPAKFMELHMSHYHRDILIEQLTRKDEPVRVASAPARVPARNPPTPKIPKTPKKPVSTDPSTGRFTCAFDCGKSFSQKSNLAHHEIKVHNRPKMKKGRSERKSTEGGYDTADEDAKDEDAEPVKKVAKEKQGPDAAEDSSFLSDTSFGNQMEDEEALPGGILQDTSKEEQEQEAGMLDLKSSEYFTKYPKAIANPQERSLKLFTESAEGLPEGWKVRTLKDPKDESRSVRHFLSIVGSEYPVTRGTS